MKKLIERLLEISDSDNENQAIPRHSLSSMSDSSTGIGNVNIGYDSFWISLLIK